MALMRRISNDQDFVDSFLKRVSDSTIEKEQNEYYSYVELGEEGDGVDILIVCALSDELEQVYEAFSVPQAKRTKSLQRYRRSYNFLYQLFSYMHFNIAVVCQNSIGMAVATSLTTRATLAMKPRLVAMVGVCAGRKEKVRLGDMIISSQVFDYTAGKRYHERFAPRPMAIIVDDDIRNYVSAYVLQNSKIKDGILQSWRGEQINHRISIYMNAIASGTSVIDDYQTIESVVNIQDDLYAIDMESYGVALAATALRTKWIVIKGVQDFADGNKSKDETLYRKFSAFGSASLLKELLPNIVEG